MALIFLQRRHQHGDPVNGHALENLKFIVEKRFVTQRNFDLKYVVYKN